MNPVYGAKQEVQLLKSLEWMIHDPWIRSFLQMETFVSKAVWLCICTHSPFLVQVGVAQQWYDELDDLASPKADPESEVIEDDLDQNTAMEDDKIRINSCVGTSPGTSEVCF